MNGLILGPWVQFSAHLEKTLMWGLISVFFEVSEDSEYIDEIISIGAVCAHLVQNRFTFEFVG